MARLSRTVVPASPHHVMQRGSRRQLLLIEPGDYALYRDLLAERGGRLTSSWTRTGRAVAEGDAGAQYDTRPDAR
jgi:hypothetical protein